MRGLAGRSFFRGLLLLSFTVMHIVANGPAFAANLPLLPVPSGTETTWEFSGTCTVDCTGTATASVTFAGATAGYQLAITAFTYQSSFTSFSWTYAQNNGYTNGYIEGNVTGNIATDSLFLTLLYPTHSIFVFNVFRGASWCVRGGSATCDPQVSSDAGVNGQFSAVPEPSTLVLLGAGLWGLATTRRRSRA